MPQDPIPQAAAFLRNAKYPIAFTGSGISVESGIPPFRGQGGLWTKYDPAFLEIHYFQNHPRDAWKILREIFYDVIEAARPNQAHVALAEMEEKGMLRALITQNIDNLHQAAGSRKVLEFHGSIRDLVCLGCLRKFSANAMIFQRDIPACPECDGLLKPDIVFFGEAIPEAVSRLAFEEAGKADLILVIGTTGEVMPAALIPRQVKSQGGMVVEINLEPSAYTAQITDVFLRGEAGERVAALFKEMTKGE